MLGLDTVDLARLQFATTVMYHIIFLALSIGLSTYLAFLEAMWLKTGNRVYLGIYHYWLPHFAVNYAAGVVSGVIMAFEFGTNWSGFSSKAGGINGVLLTYEVITAFFLEAGFFGIMMFGEGRVSRKMHFFATCIVALGAYISTFWILASNSWMQTPAGYAIENGRFIPENWWHVIFNPSQPFRFVHMSLAALIATAFVVAGIAAWHLYRNNRDTVARKMLSMALWMLTFAVPLQIVAGDVHGLNTLEHQPAKVAAMEAYWKIEPERAGMPMVVFAWPDPEQEKNRYTLEIPRLSSLYLTHSLTGKIQGLEQWPEDERPYVPLVFYAFRLMVYLGFAMLGLVALSLWLRKRRRLYDSRWFLVLTMLATPAGVIAIEAGWVTTEAGRQPWIIYGLLRTAEGVSPFSVSTLVTSLVGLWGIYTLIFAIGAYFFFKLVRRTPEESLPAEEQHDDAQENRAPRHPFSRRSRRDS
ncbi:cytochrome bd-I ubiquinol oxidase subunit 1 apoprotein [Modicisalibacter xianhensis]|uniref:Cytochrome bd-I ubiquinol oxidase subunit 1 apoprotein n=1 Tax=Modicisalibacter xianhensis TaxID=442341 RepID=A0A4R8FJ51_9GAMM|nr:cytochrome ubiquinol oxidase subunit I [Halomonas xianhensis]TDX22201.1 cytochrome bd-I ubiquinol oxidase subunit 1 apoprotein [Halomonas xianhensis]